MASGKIRSLSIRPIQSSDLSFSVAGVIGHHHQVRASLGKRVNTFDRTGLVADLSKTIPAGAPEEGRLVYDAQGLAAAVSALSLVELVNDDRAAELDRSVLSHFYLHLDRFGSKSNIASVMRADHTERVQTLTDITVMLSERDTQLSAAYGANPGVVLSQRATSGHANNAPEISKTFTAPLLMNSAGYGIDVTGGGLPSPMKHQVGASSVEPHAFLGGSYQPIHMELKLDASSPPKVSSGFLSQVTEVVQEPVETVTHLVDARHPYIDQKLETAAARSGAKQDLAEHRASEARFQNLEKLLTIEEQVSYLAVRQRQLEYLETYLTPPINGVVTAVYKDVGEAVRPGEPVLRVENDDRLLLVGLVQHRGGLQIGQGVSIRASNIYESGDIMDLVGRIVAVRGHDADDDEWDLIVEVDNANGQALIKPGGQTIRSRPPLNLHFDRDTTSIVFG